MREYTTLGSGKSTKVLDVNPYREARTVTTCSNGAAKAVARSLKRTDRMLPAALYDLAVELDGRPVEARRHLLSHFDANVAADIAGNGGSWETAEQLVADVAAAVRGETAAVVAAVRSELEGHLYGFDGVLVPARVVTDGYKRAKLDLVISGPLSWMGDFWEYLLGPHGDLASGADDPDFPVGSEVVETTELYGLMRELHDAEHPGLGFTDFSMAELFDMSGDDMPPMLLVRTDHFVAWVEHHRADDLAKVRTALGQ